MPRKRFEEPEKENSERWLLTYSDLITLLMIFFVVMYSMSQVDANKFRAMAESLNSAFKGAPPAKLELSTSVADVSLIEKSAAHSEPQSNPASSGDVKAESMTIEGIKQKLDQFAKDNDIQAKLISTVEERGLVISIQDTLLFESGSEVITPRARDILDKIATVLAVATNYIKVEGHTDNLAIQTARFPSNWELSVLRATNVVNLLQGKIPHEQLSATGYAEFRPVAANDSEVGRAHNRRVDLVILRSKYDLTEPGQQQAAMKTTGASATSGSGRH